MNNITWVNLHDKIGKQPLYRTRLKPVEIRIDGKSYFAKLQFENNGTDFYLEAVEQDKK